MGRKPVYLLLIAACLGRVAALGQTNQPYLVKDINPDGTSWPQLLTPANGRLFFLADDGTNGQELWTSDGTADGTHIVKEVVPGPDPSGVGSLTNGGSVLFFQANDGVIGAELWMTDGTEAGTVLVKDINPGLPGSFPSGTTLTLTCIPLEPVNDVFLFAAEDGSHGRELWRTDGTEEGTLMVRDVMFAGSFTFQQLTRVDDFLVFAGGTPFDNIGGFDVWKSDGTEEGTVVLKDLRGASWFTPVNGVAFFRGDDGVTGDELWKTDGTPEGTVLVKDIHPTGQSIPAPKAVVRGELYFSAFEPATGRELWKSDGTEEGTVLVRDLTPGPISGGVSYAANVGGILFLGGGADGINGTELWKSNGTEAGTVMLKDINPGPDSSLPEDMVPVNGTLYFTADDGIHGREIWKSDGTEAGTVLIADTNPGPGTGFGWELTNVDGLLFFMGGDGGSTGGELWVLDTRSSIPTLSAWGILASALLLLAAAAIILAKRRTRMV